MKFLLQSVGLLACGFALVACSRNAQKANEAGTAKPPAVGATASTPSNPAPPAEIAAVPPEAVKGKAVKTEMRNVLFHLTDQAAARIEFLSGDLFPTGRHEIPIFDDRASFEVRVSNGKISISPQALTSILNNHVFAAKDAPLKEISVSIEKDRLKIKGKMHSRGDISFETTGSLSVTPDGRVRVHTEKVRALHVPVKSMMGMLGIDLADVLNTSKIDGLDTDKNDLLMDLGQLLPPPHIRGKVTGVKIESNAIVTFFGDGGKNAAVPAATEQSNYMSFQGGPVRFGNLLMENTDLVVLDLDPGDALDWNQGHYKEQLVAGYSKITPAFGLRAYVKDYAKLPRPMAAAASEVAATSPKN